MMKYVIFMVLGLFTNFSTLAAPPTAILPMPQPPEDPRCSVSVGNSVVDFGTQTRAQLQRDGVSFSPGKRTLMLSVVCPWPRDLKLITTGSRASNGAIRYGSNGQLKLTLSDARVDGKPVQLVDITRGENSPSNKLSLQADSRFEAWRDGAAVSGKSFNARLEVEPMIGDASARVQQRTINEAQFSLNLLD